MGARGFPWLSGEREVCSVYRVRAGWRISVYGLQADRIVKGRAPCRHSFCPVRTRVGRNFSAIIFCVSRREATAHVSASHATQRDGISSLPCSGCEGKWRNVFALMTQSRKYMRALRRSWIPSCPTILNISYPLLFRINMEVIYQTAANCHFVQVSLWLIGYYNWIPIATGGQQKQ